MEPHTSVDGRGLRFGRCCPWLGGAFALLAPGLGLFHFDIAIYGLLERAWVCASFGSGADASCVAVLVLVGTAVLAIAAVALGRRALVVLVAVGMAVALMRAAHPGGWR